MRVVVSDHSGHPFQVQLSRELARRGHDVLHLSAASFQTPKGRLDATGDDPPTFSSVQLHHDEGFAKSSFLKRRRQEIEMGRKIGAEISKFGPDVVLSSNAPIDTQRMIQRATRQAASAFVFWVQDLYGEAMLRILPQRIGPLGMLVAKFYERLEGRLLVDSDHVVVIAEDFRPAVTRLAGAGAPAVTAIENWAPLDEIRQEARDNTWARGNLPITPLRIIYSGTIGAKHNPDLLFDLARGIACEVLVFSEGPAADALRLRAQRKGVENLHVAGWLPFETLPSALAGADILVVLLEDDAGVFSVPSKVLTYLCVGRPILGSMPANNLAARIITEQGAGLVVSPGHTSAFLDAAAKLASDPELRTRMGQAARTYAERTFEIGKIADEFEQVISKALKRRKIHE